MNHRHFYPTPYTYVCGYLAVIQLLAECQTPVAPPLSPGRYNNSKV